MSDRKRTRYSSSANRNLFLNVKAAFTRCFQDDLAFLTWYNETNYLADAPHWREDPEGSKDKSEAAKLLPPPGKPTMMENARNEHGKFPIVADKQRTS